MKDIPRLVREELEEVSRAARIFRDEITGMRWGGAIFLFDHMMNKAIYGGTRGRATVGRQGYDALFQSNPLPEVAKRWREDDHFANLGIAGSSPLMLSPNDRADERLNLSATRHGPIMGDRDTAGGAAKEGRLFLEDLTLFKGVEGGTVPNGQKYLNALLGLFAVPRGGGPLRVVAVQPNLGAETHTPVAGWQSQPSRLALGNADGNWRWDYLSCPWVWVFTRARWWWALWAPRGAPGTA